MLFWVDDTMSSHSFFLSSLWRIWMSSGSRLSKRLGMVFQCFCKLPLPLGQYFIRLLIYEAAKLEENIFYKALGKVECNPTVVYIVPTFQFSSFVQCTRKTHMVVIFIPIDAHTKVPHAIRFTHIFHSLDIKYLIHNDESIYKSSIFLF